MPLCFFVSDLHGVDDRYLKLFQAIETERPDAVFLGGDLLPHAMISLKKLDFFHRDFINGFLVKHLNKLREILKKDYPRVFIILGNDDSRVEEASILDAATRGIWEYIHFRSVEFGHYTVFGYSFIPPSPFQLKDWEKYDVSRYVDPGCIPPDSGFRTIAVSDYEAKYSTITNDLEMLVGTTDLEKALFLFHAPPYKTKLDRAALDGRLIDFHQVDVHIGSIAVKRFIEKKQPLLTLHGHVHESTRLTGNWHDMIGRTHLFSAAHHGAELALIRFDPAHPADATRELL
ncbi:metallophosphoesterase [candidate division CSSED10-310 bacterium]|uniref:Metallophosphoesterase n=1 Tax=candidate division CSSED10-310 bacterium TaxID=2855610 RepID=A0ABV6Z370_UNCC1